MDYDHHSGNGFLWISGRPWAILDLPWDYGMNRAASTTFNGPTTMLGAEDTVVILLGAEDARLVWWLYDGFTTVTLWQANPEVGEPPFMAGLPMTNGHFLVSKLLYQSYMILWSCGECSNLIKVMWSYSYVIMVGVMWSYGRPRHRMQLPVQYALNPWVVGAGALEVKASTAAGHWW